MQSILIIDKITDNLPQLIEAGIDILIAIVEGIMQHLSSLRSFPEIVIKIVGALIDNLPKLLSAGWDLLVEILDGIVSAIPKIPSYILKVVTGLIDEILDTDWIKVGFDILAGIGSGIIIQLDRGQVMLARASPKELKTWALESNHLQDVQR